MKFVKLFAAAVISAALLAGCSQPGTGNNSDLSESLPAASIESIAQGSSSSKASVSKNGVYTSDTNGFSIKPPKGFKVSYDMGGLAAFVSEDTQDTTDNFTVEVLAKNTENSNFDQKSYKSFLNQNYEGTMAENVKISGYSKFKKDGNTCYTANVSFSMTDSTLGKDVELFQRIYTVIGDDKIYFVSFTMTDDKYSEAFEKAFDSFKIG